jgi:hypothetical protein
MRTSVTGALTLVLTSLSCLAQEPTGYDQALARYKECMTRKPFRYQTDGRDRLAQTRSLTALGLLTDDYAKAKDYTEFSRYVLATLFSRHFDRAEAAEPLATLRKSFGKPTDTWLWMQALRIQANHGGEAEVMAVATEDKVALHRAAAIAAIGNARSGNVKAVVVPNCVQFPKKDSDRMALLGAMTGALWENRTRVNDAEYREALTAYIGLLANDVGLTHTAKVQMGRHLQVILKAPGLFVDPEPYLEILQRGEVKKPPSQTTTATPRFFGIETDGERFCYVVDMSDSMCKDISPAAKPPSAPETGPRKPKKKGAILDESDIPWNKIKTRWDLAREQLRISLTRLTPDKHFSIVWFGTESGTLDACKGMIKATRGNIDRVIAELDSIQVVVKDKLTGDELKISPDGKLRGKTNLHSGLLRGFSLAGKGLVANDAYVDPEALVEGCDTIFLLSDGAPSWDDFHIVDKDYGEDKVVLDTEYNKEAPRTPTIQYHGPYDNDEWLVEDVKRMNVLRRIKIHCIGLGEANMRLLERLAEIGNGQVFVVGEKKADSKGDTGGGTKK